MLLFVLQNDVRIPNNIILFSISFYCPEFNSAEKMRQWTKDKIAMKIYDTLDDLNKKMEELIKTTLNDIMKSITGYDFYVNTFYNIFKF